MQLTSEDLSYLSNCAEVAAKQAGELIEHYMTKTVTVQTKQGGNSYAAQVVTEVDILSEEVIKKHLQSSCEQFDLALLSEESEDDKKRLQKAFFWCIDPMDGTLAFIESTPGFSVSIALVAKTGTPLIGVVYDPVTQTLYSAVRGRGVLRNGVPWKPLSSLSEKDKTLSLICDPGLIQRDDYVKIEQLLQSTAIELGYKEIVSIAKNGAVMNACSVLENAPACYFKLAKPEQGGGSLWDFAATTAIFNELGAFVSDMFGQALDLNRTESTFMNHRGVVFSTDKILSKSLQKLTRLSELV